MRSKRKELEGKLGAFALIRAQRWLARKSPERSEKIGERLGRLLFKLSKKHRERAIANLELAFPEMSPEERERLAKRVFEHFGRTTTDFLKSGKRAIADLDASLSVEGLEHLDRALAQGKGVIMITGHFGNWERMSAWVSAHGYRLTVIARDANNATLNEAVNQLRQISGTQVIPRGNATRPILERLRRNELVGILPDQNSDEIYIPFFGKPAGTVLGPGVLHERTGAPVLACYCAWVGPKQYRFIINPPLEKQEGYQTTGEGMMRSIHASLEAIIREYPDQWLWFHDRWRSARRKGLL